MDITVFLGIRRDLTCFVYRGGVMCSSVDGGSSIFEYYFSFIAKKGQEEFYSVLHNL